MSPLPRGVCSECDGEFAVRNNGTLREHNVDGTAAKCPGSGKPAKEASHAQ